MNPLGATKQDRLSQVAVIAEEIFEDKAVAISWMTTVNDALGGKMPIFAAIPRSALAVLRNPEEDFPFLVKYADPLPEFPDEADDLCRRRYAGSANDP